MNDVIENYNDVIDLEKELHGEETRRNRERLNELLSDEFIEFGTSGSRYSKSCVLDRLPSSDAPEINSYEFEVRKLGEDVVQVFYKTDINENHILVTSQRSSLWRKVGKGWKMIFHQSTRLN